jgi:hypothetical protein
MDRSLFTIAAVQYHPRGRRDAEDPGRDGKIRNSLDFEGAIVKT